MVNPLRFGVKFAKPLTFKLYTKIGTHQRICTRGETSYINNSILSRTEKDLLD